MATLTEMQEKYLGIKADKKPPSKIEIAMGAKPPKRGTINVKGYTRRIKKGGRKR